MSDPIFPLDTWEPCFPVDENVAVDLNGHFKMRVGENMAMDMDTGEMHFTTPWPSEDSGGSEK